MAVRKNSNVTYVGPGGIIIPAHWCESSERRQRYCELFMDEDDEWKSYREREVDGKVVCGFFAE